MAKESPKQKRRRRNRSVTHYGKFLQWVMYEYGLNQTELAELMSTSQSSVSNWTYGEFDASPRANVLLADRLKFDKETRRRQARMFTFGQNTPADVPLSPTDEAKIDQVQRDWETRHEDAEAGEESDEPDDRGT